MTTTEYPFGAPDRLTLHERYGELRRDEPIVRVRMPFGEPCWLVTRYEDAKLVLGDPRFSRAMSRERDEPRTRLAEASDGGILSMDPPDHSRLRKLVAKAFTVRRVELLRERAQEIADGLVDDMLAKGAPADLVEDFALPLPITVICELLGVPYEDREDFRIWSDAFLSSTHLSAEQVRQYADNLYGYMAGLVQQRRVTPTDDLIGAMVLARDEQDQLTEAELVQLAAGVLVAGHETTASHIPNFVYTLLTHPQRWAELRADPTLVPKAVEELMRFIPLGAAAQFARYATEDVEIAGVLVRAGEPVLASIGSANLDESVFDRPDEVDFHRTAGSHIGFGHGVHHCLGAPLARMELQVALGTLVRRLPGLAFAVPEERLPWKSGMLVRGLSQLPVQW
ncbi:cytochrome P450 [Kutzneria viridogrisea]|uniref:Cytochrome P450 n=1 Tax=Kutzneria viridogrisea TaxID=47990 RepID=A0ABR6BL78_9PSEU|nr:cytochrome P450 [Kutzneria viridogrisea]